MNQQAMNQAINTILSQIGNNPDAMKALMDAIAETNKIAKEPKSEQVKKSCKYVICLKRKTVNGDTVYHPFVMTPPTCEDPRMLVINNAVDAQNEAQRYGMMMCDDVYAIPATDIQIAKLIDLLKQCNKRIVDAVEAAVETVAGVSPNIDKDMLCSQYMQQMMQNCNNVIGSSLTQDSVIIREDIEVIHPDRDIEDIDDEDWDEEDDECDNCPCSNCPYGCCQQLIKHLNIGGWLQQLAPVYSI